MFKLLGARSGGEYRLRELADRTLRSHASDTRHPPSDRPLTRRRSAAEVQRQFVGTERSVAPTLSLLGVDPQCSCAS